MPKPDAIRYTADSEYDDRTRVCDTLEVHHATTKSLPALEDLMDPGGRQVSANEAMGPFGERIGKVPPWARAYTSASSFDHQAYTVEVCNTSLDPEWGISDEAHWALARLFVELYREGMVRFIGRGIGGILGHHEVPGTYPTACPGPCMDLDRIVRYALQILNGTLEGDEEMPLTIRDEKNGQTLTVWPGRAYHHPDARSVEIAEYLGEVKNCNPDDFNRALRMHGLGELVGNLPVAGQFYPPAEPRGVVTVRSLGSGNVLSLAPCYAYHHPSDPSVRLANYTQVGDGRRAKVLDLNAADFAETLRIYGLAALVGADGKPSSLYPRPGNSYASAAVEVPTLTDAQLAKIGQAVPGVTDATVKKIAAATRAEIVAPERT